MGRKAWDGRWRLRSQQCRRRRCRRSSACLLLCLLAASHTPPVSAAPPCPSLRTSPGSRLAGRWGPSCGPGGGKGSAGCCWRAGPRPRCPAASAALGAGSTHRTSPAAAPQQPLLTHGPTRSRRAPAPPRCCPRCAPQTRAARRRGLRRRARHSTVQGGCASWGQLDERRQGKPAIQRRAAWHARSATTPRPPTALPTLAVGKGALRVAALVLPPRQQPVQALMPQPAPQELGGRNTRVWLGTASSGAGRPTPCCGGAAPPTPSLASGQVRACDAGALLAPRQARALPCPALLLTAPESA